MLKRFFVPALAGLLAGSMLCFPREAAQAASQACRLWAVAVLPSLFPFLLCMLIITGNLSAGRHRGVNRFLGLPAGLSPLVVMGLMSGSPGGSRLTQELVLKDDAGRAALKRFSLYTGTMSPMFFVGTLGGWMLSPTLGWFMLLAHWMSALCTGQLSRLFFACPPLPPVALSHESRRLGLSHVIHSAAMAMFTVCGLMVLGSVAAGMVSCTFPYLPEGILAGLQAILEVTAGCSRILTVPLPESLPALRPALLCAAASFSGMSILLQNLAFLQDGGVTFPFLLTGALCRCILSFGLCLLLFPLVESVAFPTFAPVVQSVPALPTVILLLWFCGLTFPGMPGNKKLFS